MTVIAYSSRHRVMAADSRCTLDDGMHFTSCDKIYRLSSGALVGFTGEADVRDALDVLQSATPDRMPSRRELAGLELEFTALVVFPVGRIFLASAEVAKRADGDHCEWAGEVDECTDPIAAIGSGAAYAYGAMEFGATPVEACELACRRATECAPPVKWWPLDVPKGGKRKRARHA